MSVDFELGEYVKKPEQDLKWGNATIDARTNISNREAYVVYKREFTTAINDYYVVETLLGMLTVGRNRVKVLNQDIIRLVIEYAYSGYGPLVTASLMNDQTSRNKLLQDFDDRESSFKIFVRKRPMMRWELEVQNYDVVDTISRPNEIVVHDGRLARNGRQLTMTHRHYFATRCFGPDAGNAEVCQQTIEPLLHNVEMGYPSTLLCYGQTGTGKTHTLLGALHYISNRLRHRKLDITFYEIRGKRCFDLFNDHNVVNIRADENREVHVRGCRHVSFDRMDPLSFLRLLSDALSLRASKATERNPMSSRSHAVCTIYLDKEDSEEEDGNSCSSSSDGESGVCVSTAKSPSKIRQIRCPKLRLVDLAGSERNFETLNMTALEHRESADINFTLMALKDCFRAYNYERSGRVPVGSLTGYASEDIAMKQAQDERRSAETDRSRRTANSVPVYHKHDIAASASSKKHKNTITTGSRFAMAPYRAALLTRLLRECFLVGSNHKTSIIATVSPTPTDIEHTINTLEHVTMMDSYLQDMSNSNTVDIFINGAALPMSPVEQWTHSELSVWLTSVEGGRFSQLALPANIDGATLLGMNVTSVSAMFAGEMRQARQDEEGAAWVEEADANRRQNVIGKALWAALRREQHASTLRAMQAEKLQTDDDDRH